MSTIVNNQAPSAPRKQRVGFFGLLGLLFIGLKLAGQIAWPWKLVLLPLYGPFAIWLSIAVVLFVIGIVAAGVAAAVSK